MPYFPSRTRLFVLNDVMNDDMKYFKWHTASTSTCFCCYKVWFVHCLHWCATAKITSNAE